MIFLIIFPEYVFRIAEFFTIRSHDLNPWKSGWTILEKFKTIYKFACFAFCYSALEFLSSKYITELSRQIRQIIFKT